MKWLVTGGAGFIGSNVAKRLIDEAHKVIIFDNLSRKGTDLNLGWLKEQGQFEFIKGDVRNYIQLVNVFKKHKDIDVVIHEAGQVAVTTSVTNPREDFNINAVGTFNVCEVIREYSPEAILLNASTNKVYGKMEHVRVIERNGRYQYADLKFCVSEKQPLDFHSPYGCSKGAAEQYVKDYSKIYGLRTVNFRQSCIYGYRQFGIEDQGWVAWFTIAAVLDKHIVIYGDGKQVRDVLFVTDLIECYFRAVDNINLTNGKVYNIGGGEANQLSLMELISILEEISSKKIKYSFNDWRPGDQKIFVCQIKRALDDFGWKPKVSISEGIKKLYEWVIENRDLFI